MCVCVCVCGWYMRYGSLVRSRLCEGRDARTPGRGLCMVGSAPGRVRSDWDVWCMHRFGSVRSDRYVVHNRFCRFEGIIVRDHKDADLWISGHEIRQLALLVYATLLAKHSVKG